MAQRDNMTTNEQTDWKKAAGNRKVPEDQNLTARDEALDVEEDEADLELEAEDEEEALDLDDDSYVDEDVAADFQDKGSRGSQSAREGRSIRE